MNTPANSGLEEMSSNSPPVYTPEENKEIYYETQEDLLDLRNKTQNNGSEQQGM